MAQSIEAVDLFVNGALTCRSFTPPANCITDAAIQAAAGVQASKLQHQYEKVFRQASTSTAATGQEVVHAVKGATGVVLEFSVGAITAALGAATAVMDLLKNGVSMLSAAVTLDSTTANYILKPGTLA